ncbi:MerR family transcriptional regulator [Pseudalgibacter alginicilyticus]|uniref:MerR family transcriptional regulator n=1 Tax=Pseudalgibacter alginicilyticus TaxID=1736674 RepID=A0A0N7HY63_9FLAO|nr:MerR family transcriptional regulator [Pseudalgibacter alginicilyticus]ALJ04374.1 MerR family transcriptional regulator [Pseudalgibacter alginicilyticus]
MNNIKTHFSIKDLENLTGIKAHTIRIWEKRYNLLSPNRSDTNIRNYSLESFQKLLNISYLNNNGIKISKIASLEENQIPIKVREIASRSKAEDYAINAFKLAMVNFDQVLFYNTYNNLIENKSFNDIFYNIFLPLLNEIGLLWQTNTITPAHEHFISIHIKQKILINIERIQTLDPKPKSKTFVLFLPENEIHDIGLLFINYQLISKGYHSIFLGGNIPMESLTDLFTFFDDITFISYFTVSPELDAIPNYINKFNNMLLKDNKTKLLLLGKKLNHLNTIELPKKVIRYNSIESLIEKL